jgi:hypothetical protein
MGRLRETEMFVKVVETGSFSAAARDLNIGQPAEWLTANRRVSFSSVWDAWIEHYGHRFADGATRSQKGQS